MAVITSAPGSGIERQALALIGHADLLDSVAGFAGRKNV
jgi:hypothetical protein